jgi:hypothetical protein
MILVDTQEVKRLYEQQLIDQQKSLSDYQKNKTLSSTPPKQKRSKRSTNEVITIEWYRDGTKIIETNKTEKKPISDNGFALYSNGTLRFQGSNATTGEYRCKAKFTAYDDSKAKFSIGPILSQATVVEAACKKLLNLIALKLQLIVPHCQQI